MDKSPCLLCGKSTGDFVGLCDLCCKVIKVKSDAFARYSRQRLDELKKSGVKYLAATLVLLCVVSRAFAACGEYTFCNSPLDYYVPANLMALADRAAESRQASFWKNLHCTNTSDEKFGRVTCEIDGKEIVWEDERQDYYKPEPVIIFVPVNGTPQILAETLDAVAH